jgi:hypothetical protein
MTWARRDEATLDGICADESYYEGRRMEVLCESGMDPGGSGHPDDDMKRYYLLCLRVRAALVVGWR